MDDLTPERLRQIEGRWKSDVDLKLDRVVAFVEKSEKFIDMLMEREAARAKLRTAVIEKTIIGVVWALVVFVAVSSWQSLKAALK